MVCYSSRRRKGEGGEGEKLVVKKNVSSEWELFGALARDLRMQELRRPVDKLKTYLAVFKEEILWLNGSIEVLVE